MSSTGGGIRRASAEAIKDLLDRVQLWLPGLREGSMQGPYRLATQQHGNLQVHGEAHAAVSYGRWPSMTHRPDGSTAYLPHDAKSKHQQTRSLSSRGLRPTTCHARSRARS